MTPEQIVADVVASHELDGARIAPQWRDVLLGIATGALDADEVLRGEVEAARRLAS